MRVFLLAASRGSCPSGKPLLHPTATISWSAPFSDDKTIRPRLGPIITYKLSYTQFHRCNRHVADFSYWPGHTSFQLRSPDFDPSPPWKTLVGFQIPEGTHAESSRPGALTTIMASPPKPWERPGATPATSGWLPPPPCYALCNQEDPLTIHQQHSLHHLPRPLPPPPQPCLQPR